MTPIALLMNMIQSTGFKVLGTLAILVLVGIALFSLYDMYLRRIELKQRIELNKYQLSQIS